MLHLMLKHKWKVKLFLIIEYKGSSQNDTTYELPDGQNITIGDQKFRCP